MVGFSDDQQSQTYFLQPMNALKHAGIHLDAAAPLLSARNGARIISGGQVDAQALDIAELQLTRLAADVPSGTWFLHRPLHERGLSCEIVKALEVFAPMFQRPSRVLPEAGCP